MEAVWAPLAASVPPPQLPAIIHGDYRLNNTILDANDSGRIRAVVNWELAAIRDPPADLGLMLVYWPQADDPPYRLSAQDRAMRVMTLPGFWRREQVVEEYARRSGRDVSPLGWYYVLGFYKLAVICQGIHARYLAGVTRGEGFDAYAYLGRRTNDEQRAAGGRVLVTSRTNAVDAALIPVVQALGGC